MIAPAGKEWFHRTHNSVDPPPPETLSSQKPQLLLTMPMIPLKELLFKNDDIHPCVEDIFNTHFGTNENLSMSVPELLISYHQSHRAIMDYIEIMEPSYDLDLISVIVHAYIAEFFNLNDTTSQTLRSLLELKDGVSA